MDIDRRSFVQSALVAAGGAVGTAEAAENLVQAPAAAQPIQLALTPDLRALDPTAPLPPKPDGIHAPQMRRWTEQRWILDNVIRANGIDWDQPRLPGLAAALGPESTADIAAIRTRVQKFADITPAFEAVARRREAKAIELETGGDRTGARDNYFMAANYWASAQWPIDENNERNIFFNQKKRENFLKYAKLAEHRVESAWIPLKDKALPGWLHLPYGYQSGRVPAVVAIPGMDGYKERSVALNGDRYLSRGIAVLVVEGPGQYESAAHGIRVSVASWQAAGPAMFTWLAARPEIDAQKIGIVGQSFGSLFATLAAAAEPRFMAIAVGATCLEPGCGTIFEEASPTFKKRFMYMAGITDEAEFDKFRLSLSWEGSIEKIRVPYLCVAGEFDELSPLEHTERMFQVLKSPKQLVIYADSRHSVGGVPSVSLGPAPALLQAEWMANRFSGKPLTSERWFIDATGRINKTAYA